MWIIDRFEETIAVIETDDGMTVYYFSPWADPVKDWENYEPGEPF